MPDAILGLSAFYHDSAAAILVDGQIVAAAQEERFTRKKHDPDFPAKALAYVMAESGLKLSDLSAVAFYDKPYLKFERLLETYHGFAPRGLKSFLMAMPVWIKEKLMMRSLLAGGTGQGGRRRPPDAVPGAPPVPCGQRLLSVALRGGGHPHPGRRGRMGHLHHRSRPGQGDLHPAGVAIPALPGPALFGLHLLLRLQGQQRRIQAHGPGPLRQPRGGPGQTLAGVDSGGAGRLAGRRLAPAQHGLFRLSPPG